MPTWNFTDLHPGDKTRDPIQGEFFTNDSIGRSGEALVREGIQNALDAALSGAAVHVRIFVSGSGFGVPADIIGRYCNGLWEHLAADGNGLASPPSPDEDCSFLLFEDFGTIGLQGDVGQYFPREGVRNPFYHFVRAEGRSDKGEDQRGRWGVGKYVFPSASRANTILCATIRSDDNRRLVFGQSVLKTHHVGKRIFKPDGFFGDLQESGITLPLGDSKTFSAFQKVFNLSRTTEAGLSIVVPWHDPDITARDLLISTLVGYFYPILAGRLTVNIESPDSEWKLTPESIEHLVKSEEDETLRELRELFPLARAIREQAVHFTLGPPDPQGAVRWSEEMVSKEDREKIAAMLDADQCVVIRVPLIIRRKKAKEGGSYFDVALKRDMNCQYARPVFVREGIIISDVQCPRSRNLRSIVVVDDGPLATMLGDAENPSHTRWENGSHFKDKYTYGKSYITFVSNAVNELVKLATSARETVDDTIMRDVFFFSTPEGGDLEEGGTQRRKPKLALAEDFVPPSRQQPQFRVDDQHGGFAIAATQDQRPPARIDVRVAYDLRKGNPLSNYDPCDFHIGRNGVRVMSEGAVTASVIEGNRLTLDVRGVPFRCVVTGFDAERDLFVQARPAGGVNDDQES